MNIRRTVSQFSKQGNQLYALVESIGNGLASVRLAGTSRRLTNLPMVESNIAVGDNVLVDFSSGTPPIVKKVYSSPLLDGVSLAEDLATAPGVLSGEAEVSGGWSVYKSSDSVVSPGSYTNIAFDADLWDDDSALGSGVITIPASGIYLVTLTLAAYGFDAPSSTPWNPDLATARSWWAETDANYFIGRIVGSTYGVVAHGTGWGQDAEANTTLATLSLSGIVIATKDETLTVSVKVTNTSSVTFPYDSSYYLYQRFSGQRMDLTIEESAAALEILGSL